MLLVLLQIALPLLLIASLAWPVRDRAIRIVRLAVAVLAVLATQLIGLWLLLPSWTPWLLWALLVIAGTFSWRHIKQREPARWPRLALLAGSGLLLIPLGWITTNALLGRSPPDGEVVDLAAPFPPGHYLVANGGSVQLINAHLRTLPRATIGQRNYWGQSYGLDITIMDRFGLMAQGTVPILAPCNGRVILTHDGEADGAPVDLTSPTARAGNFVLVRCGSVDILLAHLRNGSLQTEQGDPVRQGQPIGNLGNSGASDMPHLHIHAQRPGTAAAPFSGIPVPVRIGGRYLVRGDQL
jgi:hypothetical protein